MEMFGRVRSRAQMRLLSWLPRRIIARDFSLFPVQTPAKTPPILFCFTLQDLSHSVKQIHCLQTLHVLVGDAGGQVAEI